MFDLSIAILKNMSIDQNQAFENPIVFKKFRESISFLLEQSAFPEAIKAAKTAVDCATEDSLDKVNALIWLGKLYLLSSEPGHFEMADKTLQSASDIVQKQGSSTENSNRMLAIKGNFYFLMIEYHLKNGKISHIDRFINSNGTAEDAAKLNWKTRFQAILHFLKCEFNSAKSSIQSLRQAPNQNNFVDTALMDIFKFGALLAELNQGKCNSIENIKNHLVKEVYPHFDTACEKFKKSPQKWNHQHYLKEYFKLIMMMNLVTKEGSHHAYFYVMKLANKIILPKGQKKLRDEIGIACSKIFEDFDDNKKITLSNYPIKNAEIPNLQKANVIAARSNQNSNITSPRLQ